MDFSTTLPKIIQNLDWELIGDYLSLFDLADQLDSLKQLHGTSSSI